MLIQEEKIAKMKRNGDMAKKIKVVDHKIEDKKVKTIQGKNKTKK